MEPENITWKPFRLTHVEYPEGDSFGKLMAIASLFPIALIVGNFSLILFRRDLHSVSGFWVSFQYFILAFLSGVECLIHFFLMITIATTLIKLINDEEKL